MAVPAGAQSNASLEPLETYTLYGMHGNFLGSTIAPDGCNMKGDGKPEVLLSDWGWKRNGNQVGAAYIVSWEDFAKAEKKPLPIDDQDLGVTRIEHDTQLQAPMLGFESACLGNINGDQYDDAILSSHQKTDAPPVIFGQEDLDLSLIHI